MKARVRYGSIEGEKYQSYDVLFLEQLILLLMNFDTPAVRTKQADVPNPSRKSCG